MNAMTEGLVTIALAIVGLGALSVLVSKQSNTVGVTQAVASGFGNDLGVAMSPVTGAAVSLNLDYPGNSLTSMFGS